MKLYMKMKILEVLTVLRLISGPSKGPNRKLEIEYWEYGGDCNDRLLFALTPIELLHLAQCIKRLNERELMNEATEGNNLNVQKIETSQINETDKLSKKNI